MDIVSFIETYMLHLVSGGNGYALIDWEDQTTVKAIWIMRPDKITVLRDPTTREIVYSYQTENAGSVNIPPYRVWHTPGLGYDGLVGYSPLRMAAETIGLGLASRKSGAKLFANGMRVGGYMEHPNKMSDEAQKRFKKAIADQHEGLDNWHRLLILEEGMKYNKAMIPPEEAQMLETMNLSVREMARFYLIQPHKIGDMERATFGNIEEQNIEFVVDTLRYWLVKLEKSAKRKLFRPDEKKDYFVEFLLDALLRGNIESRYRAYAVGRNWGWLSANDVLEMENHNPIGPDGDVYMNPANMIPADKFDGMIPKPPNKPTGQ
jgi:HK97 family phage portal protein